MCLARTKNKKLELLKNADFWLQGLLLLLLPWYKPITNVCSKQNIVWRWILSWYYPLGQHYTVELMPAKSKRKWSGQNDHESEQKRLRKWQIIVRFIDWKGCMKKNIPQILKRSIRDAIPIPDWLRGVVWRFISGGRELLLANPGIYELLLSIETSESEKLILKDIHRTLPSQELFQTVDGPRHRSLHNVLKAYSVYDRGVGYTRRYILQYNFNLVLKEIGWEENHTHRRLSDAC